MSCRRSPEDPCHSFLANSEAGIFICNDSQPFIRAYKSILLSDFSDCKFYRLITYSLNYQYLISILNFLPFNCFHCTLRLIWWKTTNRNPITFPCYCSIFSFLLLSEVTTFLHLLYVEALTLCQGKMCLWFTNTVLLQKYSSHFTISFTSYSLLWPVLENKGF